VSAVTVRYSPRGATVSSAGSPLQAVILGRAGDAIITLPPTLDDGNAYKAGVRLNFVRRGLWLHTTQTGSASGNNGDVVTIAMSGSTAVNSPTKIHWTNNNAGSIAITEYIVYSNAPSGITVREAETLGGFTVASGSAQLARGGSIIQSNLLPGFTEAASSTLSAGSSTRRFGILANAYQSSGTTGLMRVGISSSAATAASSCYTPWVQPSTSGRTWTPVGILAIDGQATYIALQTYAPSGSPVILVDSLVLVDLDQGGIIGVVRNNSSSITTEAAVIDHKYVEWPTPMVQGGAGSYGYSMQTSAYAGTSSGSVYMCLLQNFGGSPGALNWRAASASGSLLTNTWTITRTVGYVTPV